MELWTKEEAAEYKRRTNFQFSKFRKIADSGWKECGFNINAH